MTENALNHSSSASSPTIFFFMKDVFAADVSGRTVALSFAPELTIELVPLHTGREAA